MFGHSSQLSFELADETVFGGPDSDAYSAPVEISPRAAARRSRLRSAAVVLTVAAVLTGVAVAGRAPSRVAPSGSSQSRRPVVVPRAVIQHRREEPDRSPRRRGRPDRATQRSQRRPRRPIGPTPSPPPPKARPVAPPAPQPAPETEFF